MKAIHQKTIVLFALLFAYGTLLTPEASAELDPNFYVQISNKEVFSSPAMGPFRVKGIANFSFDDFQSASVTATDEDRGITYDVQDQVEYDHETGLWSFGVDLVKESWGGQYDGRYTLNVSITRNDGYVSSDSLTMTVDFDKSLRYTTEASFAIESLEDIAIKNGAGEFTGQSFDLYLPKYDLLEERPLIVFIHGGGFHSGNKNEMREFAKFYASMGYAASTISYELTPSLAAPIPAIDRLEEILGALYRGLNDIREGINHLGNDAVLYGIDAHSIAVIGWSAGCALALGSEALTNNGEFITIGEGLTVEAPDLIDLNNNLTVGAVVGASGMLGPQLFDFIRENPAPIKMIAFEIDTANEGDPELPFNEMTTCEAFRAKGGTCDFEYLPGRGHYVDFSAEHERINPFIREKLGL